MVMVLRDADGVEWECTDVSDGRSSYATYECRRVDVAEAHPRRISIPRASNLNDPAVARSMLSR